MKIFIGSDHAGYSLKEEIKNYLQEKGHEVLDHGANSATESVDYPKYGHMVAKSVVADGSTLGVLVCGSGIGISIAANKVEGARAALCHSVELAKLARQHNNANMISIGARFTESKLAFEMVDAFLTTEFEGGRHQTRVDMIEDKIGE